jgi:NitT/TauT family transport system permease protein
MATLKKPWQGPRRVQKIIWFVSLMAIWEIYTQVGHVNPMLLPPLSLIFGVMIKGLVSGELLAQLGQSLLMVFVGLGSAFLVALLMAYTGYFNQWLGSLFELLAGVLHPLPGIALLPVVILWVGVGLPAVFVIVIHAVLWALYLEVKNGFETMDQDLIEVAHNHGATPLQLFIYVLVPCNFAVIRTGLLIGWSRGWRALISAEMVFGAISTLGGMGWYLYERRAYMDTPGIYAGILLLIGVGALMEGLSSVGQGGGKTV